MKKHQSIAVSESHQIISIVGILSILLAGFLFLRTTGEIQAASAEPQQPLVLGKLAFGTMISTFSGPQFQISTANADGTGQVGVTNFPPANAPTWSPDATKLAYSLGNTEISVINVNGTNQINLTSTQNINETNPTWSITGKIAYERDGQIWIMNDDGTNQTQFPGITQFATTSPVWSANGAQLAFVSDGEIWKINADGTNEQRVTTNSTVDTDPDWSPDGTKIIFAKGGSGISTINANGTNEVALTNISGDTDPAWSPDGTIIAFKRVGTSGGIYLMDVTGGNQVRIIADVPGSTGSTSNDPTWQPIAQTPNTFIISGRITRSNLSLSGVTVNLSGTTNATATTDAAGNYQFSGLQPGRFYRVSPSFLNHYFTPPNRSFNNLSSNQIADFTALGVCVGSNCVQNGRIAFVRSSDIYTMNQDGTNQISLTNSAATDTSPNYSPDGTKIVFSTNRDGNNEIYLMNPDGSNPIRLTNNSSSDTDPSYSPDGNSIVFMSNRDGNDEIYKMNSDGTNQIRLTNDSVQQFTPSFSPDGSKIIFATSIPNGGIHLINTDGTNQQTIPGPNGFYFKPMYSPNGQKIIFNYGDDVTTQSTWTMNTDGTNRVLLFNTGRNASYSPDGTKICFNSPFIFSQGIYTIDSNGNNGSSLRLTTQSDDSPDWQPILAPRRTAFDFDGDGRSDISVYRPSTNVWYLLGSTAGYSARYVTFTSTHRIAPVDYDGDLKTDVAIFSGNFFYIRTSFENRFQAENFGMTDDVPMAGDWDGDGKADAAVYRSETQSHFYYRGTMGNPNGNITFLPWGTTGDKPVRGDFDGDGKQDAAVYRPNNSTWYVRKSSDGGLLAANWGVNSDKRFEGDFDGDGKTDFCVFRPSSGTWYVLQSSNNQMLAVPFGLSTDQIAPADYNGDGKTDFAVFRDGIWYILYSNNYSFNVGYFGTTGDVAVPSAFIP